MAHRTPADALAHVRHWVLDLDNTLYPPSARLFDQIEVLMTDWVMRRLSVASSEADRLRRAYWLRYGTTLAGLMAEHGLDPEDYMEHVHDISLDHLAPDAMLTRRIRALPGRRIVFTNGSAPYAERVLAACGLAGCFDGIFGVEHAGYTPKPEPAAFERVFARAGVTAASAAMFEDDARNLAAPRAMGLGTIHVAPEPESASHIDRHTDDLTHFLGQLAPGGQDCPGWQGTQHDRSVIHARPRWMMGSLDPTDATLRVIPPPPRRRGGRRAVPR